MNPGMDGPERMAWGRCVRCGTEARLHAASSLCLSCQSELAHGPPSTGHSYLTPVVHQYRPAWGQHNPPQYIYYPPPPPLYTEPSSHDIATRIGIAFSLVGLLIFPFPLGGMVFCGIGMILCHIGRERGHQWADIGFKVGTVGFIINIVYSIFTLSDLSML
jgi:hypothetical protein